MTDPSLFTPGSPEDQRTPPYHISAFLPSSHSSQPAASSATSKGSSRSHCQEDFQIQKEQVESYREKVTERRTQLREFRDDLRAGRGDLCELQNRLQEALQQYWDGQEGYDKASLDNLRQETEQAFERLGQIEVDYNEAEDDLRILEFKLGLHETRFYGHTLSLEPNRGAEAAVLGSSVYSSPLQSNPSLDNGGSVSTRARYRIRKAEARIASARLQELEDEKEQLLILEDNQGFTTSQLEAADADFLANFDLLYQQQYEEWEALQRDLAVLRHEAGSPTSSKSEGTESLSEKDVIPHTPKSYPGRPAKESRRFSTALGRRNSDGHGSADHSRSSRQRVNKWVVEVLQASPLQRRMSEEFLLDPHLNHRTWWRFVLRFRQIDNLLRLDNNVNASLLDESEADLPRTRKISEDSSKMPPSAVDPHRHEPRTRGHSDLELYTYADRPTSPYSGNSDPATGDLSALAYEDDYTFLWKADG